MTIILLLSKRGCPVPAEAEQFNAPPDRRQQIIDGRIRNLEKQIREFQKQLRKCEEDHGFC